MDYRAFQEKYGNKVNKALTDQKYIEWLIEILRDEGFGVAKQVIINDGFNTEAVVLSEDATTINYQVNEFNSRFPTTAVEIVEGNTYEWGQALAPADLSVDITTTRTSYALYSLAFTGLDQADQDEIDINAAGVNDNLTVDFDWEFSGVQSLTTLVNGDTLIGTVTAVDNKAQTEIRTVEITRQNRYMWGLTNAPMSSADIVTALEAATGDVVPGDEDADFYQLTTGIGNFPSTLAIDTFGSTRTLFIVDIDDLNFALESQVPFEMPESTQSINVNSISGGVANVTRSYVIKTTDLNTIVNLIKL